MRHVFVGNPSARDAQLEAGVIGSRKIDEGIDVTEALLRPPRLSVCLPVYNFGRFLGETLDSIIRQNLNDVEIVVVDGASTDDTAQVVAARMKDCPRLRYVILPAKGGIDADMALSVEHASGEYCWLFSGDDLMDRGAIASVLSAIDVHPEVDVVVCRHLNCDIDMEFLRDYPIFSSPEARYVDLSDGSARNALFNDAVCTEAVFSFMSGLVVNRDRWLQGVVAEGFARSCWAHVTRLLSLANTGKLTVLYPNGCWIKKRGDNDSFASQGLVRRFEIAIDGYLGIAAHFYGANSAEASSVKRMLRNEMGLREFFFVRSTVHGDETHAQRVELDGLFKRLYGAGAGANFRFAIYRCLPMSMYRLARSFIHSLRLLKRIGGR